MRLFHFEKLPIGSYAKRDAWFSVLKMASAVEAQLKYCKDALNSTPDYNQKGYSLDWWPLGLEGLDA